MQVKHLMRKNPVTVNLDTPLSSVWHLLSEKMIHMLPVVDEKNTLKGIITAEDLLKNLVPDYRTFFEQYYPKSPTIGDIEDRIDKHTRLCARELMNTKIHTADQDMELFKALSLLITRHVRILPVIGDERTLKGFIVEKDIFKYLFAKKKHIFKKLKAINPEKNNRKENKTISLRDLAENLKEKPDKYLKFLKDKLG